MGSSTMSSWGSLRSAWAIPDALLHAAGKAAERTLAGLCQVDQLEQFVDAAGGSRSIEPFYGCKVLKKLNRVQIGIDAEVLRQITENGTECIGGARDVDAVPEHAAFGGPGNRGQNAHQRGLAGAVGSQQAKHARFQFQTEVAQGDNALAISLGYILNGKLHRLPQFRIGMILRSRQG